MKRITKCPLLVLVLLTSLTFAILKAYGKIPDQLQIEEVSTSKIGITEEIEPGIEGGISGNELEKQGDIQTEVPKQDDTISENQVPQTYEFSKVDDSYFSDALFIGDSRTDGLRDYSKKLTSATFYAKAGMSIHNLLESEIVELQDGTKISVEEGLKHFSFGKIYIMVGINELGRGNAESFFKQYRDVVSRIKTLQPNAIIFVEAIMKVSEEKSETDPIFNNLNIAARNGQIHSLENKTDIFYLDMNEAVVDEKGNLKEEYSFDGIHLKAVYYPVWEDFLKENGIVK